MTSLEKALRDFAQFAARLKGDEKSEAQTFLFHLLAAFGHDANTLPEGSTFEYRVRFPGERTKFADFVWPGRCLIEMKSRGVKLSKHYQQTFDYWLKRRKPQPTVSESFEVDKAACLLFEAWLPGKWLPRRQDPDYHVDYRVEVVTGGEPTGLHFQAQVKGRSTHKRRTSKLAEPMRTKHLRYYLRCQEPVFIFLIDPATKQGNWLFIQAYLRERVSFQELSKRKTLTLRFDAQRHLESRVLFEKELREAWAYMRDLHPGSPIAAILAEKQRLEQLDPRYVVDIAATHESQSLHVQPRGPMHGGSKLRFLAGAGDSQMRTLYEKGQSFRVKATDVEAPGSPILGDILRQVGENEITIHSGATVSGCLHLFLRPHGENSFLQIDGEWLLAAKRVSFIGALAESPLRVEFVSEPAEGDTSGYVATTFKLNWAAWEGQPLLSLAYFNQLSRLATADEYDLLCLFRGNQGQRATFVLPECETRARFGEAVDWLSKCRRVAQRLAVNPPLHSVGVLNGKQLDDVRLLVKLLECGGHEQVNAGEELGVSADMPPGGTPSLQEPLALTRTEPATMLNFFGVPVRVGPISHTWTDMHLVSTKALSATRIELSFKGGPKSVWRVEYKPEPASGVAQPPPAPSPAA
jgi:hypothetical protein